MKSSALELQGSFRNVMATVATPVSVITAVAGGQPHGTTVSAFASLSLDPPMMLVSLGRTSELLQLIRTSKRFGVNVLGDTHHEWAVTFSRKGGPVKFAGVAWELSAGLPRLPGTGWLACEVDQLIDGGDHVIVLGNVTAAAAAECAPLTYCARAFGTHSPLDPT